MNENSEIQASKRTNAEKIVVNMSSTLAAASPVGYGSISDQKNQPESFNEIKELLYADKREEIVKITKTSVPLAFTFLLQFLITTITVVTVGRIGTIELGGVSIANVTYSVSTAIFIGLATCLDTLCPQAYGRGNRTLVLLYFLRCVMISLAAAIPIVLVWFKSAFLLKLMIQDEQVVAYASKYLKIMCLTAPGYIVFECGKKFLQSQNDFVTGQRLLWLGVPFNIGMNLFLIKHFGFIGAPIAVALTYNLIGALMLYKCSKTECWKEIANISFKQCFESWSTLISLAIPGIIMLEAEFFAFEVLTVLAGRFGTTVLAAQSVAASLQSLMFQIPFSFSVAASNRIAYHIGSGDLHKCKLATKVTLINIACVLCAINFSLFTFLGNPLSSIFTKDKEVVKISCSILKIIAVNQLYDVFNILSAGCLRAQGRQKIGGYLNLISYYVIGLPVGIYLGFKTSLGVDGFWVGLGVGIFVLATAETYFVVRSNWNEIIERSKKLHGLGV